LHCVVKGTKSADSYHCWYFVSFVFASSFTHDTKRIVMTNPVSTIYYTLTVRASMRAKPDERLRCKAAQNKITLNIDTEFENALSPNSCADSKPPYAYVSTGVARFCFQNFMQHLKQQLSIQTLRPQLARARSLAQCSTLLSVQGSGKWYSTINTDPDLM
jgi:hypothetical protein